MTCFQSRDRNRLRFCVGVENYMVLTYGWQLTCFFVYRMKITCFEWGNRLSWFYVGRLGFVCGPEITWFEFE